MKGNDLSQLAVDLDTLSKFDDEGKLSWTGDGVCRRPEFHQALYLNRREPTSESSWGVNPGGDNGSYFQRVRVIGVKSANRSTLAVEVNGQTRMFKDGEGVTFPKNVGAPSILSAIQYWRGP